MPSTNEIIAGLALLIVGYVLAKILGHLTTPAIVQKVEAAVKADETELLLKMLDAMADNTGDIKKVSEAQASIQARAQRVALIKAKAQGL